MAFLTAVPKNNVLPWIRILTPMLTFLDTLTITFSFLALLPFVPPLPKLAKSIGSEVIFDTTVLSANGFGGLPCTLGDIKKLHE